MVKKILGKICSDNLIELISHPPYLYFSLSVFLSQIAYNMMSVVLLFLIFHLTSSNFSVSIMVLTFLIPQILLSFFGGVIADLKNKKKILIYGNLLRGIALLILFFNTNSIGVVYLVSILVSIATQFYVPAEIPMIPYLVRKNHLILANSIFGISFFGSILVGYVLAGPFIDLVGRSNVFLILAALFMISALFAYLIPSLYRKEHYVDKDSALVHDVPATEVAQSYANINFIKKIFTDLSESYLIIKNTKKAASAFFLLTASQIIILVIATIVPGYAKDILSLSAEKLSLMLFAPAAIGTIISAVLLSTKYAKADKNMVMNVGIFISGIALCFFPLTKRIDTIPILNLLPLNTFRFSILLAFLAGFANSLIFIPSQTIIQEVIPEHFRSKIYGLLFAMIGVFSLLPIILTGTLADIIGVGSVLVGVGVLIFLIGLIRIKGVFKR